MATKVRNKGFEPELEFEPKKKARSAGYSKQKGNAYERKIVNELKTLTGDDAIATSRAESKSLDDMKIDVYDPNDSIPCYFQLKSTQVTHSVKKINAEVGKKDKPLCILWNIQEKKETNICSAGEYAIIPKIFFYELLKFKQELMKVREVDEEGTKG